MLPRPPGCTLTGSLFPSSTLFGSLVFALGRRLGSRRFGPEGFGVLVLCRCVPCRCVVGFAGAVGLLVVAVARRLAAAGFRRLAGLAAFLAPARPPTAAALAAALALAVTLLAGGFGLHLGFALALALVAQLLLVLLDAGARLLEAGLGGVGLAALGI